MFSWGSGSWGSGSWGGDATALLAPPVSRVGLTGNATSLATNPDTGDLLMPIQFIHGPPAIGQQICEALRTFAGEHFLDTRIGTPYFQLVFGRKAPISLIDSMFRKVILLVQGVVSVDVQSVLDRPNRILATAFSTTLDDGTILTTDRQPLIVFGNIGGLSYG